jgi:hypothetical protein
MQLGIIPVSRDQPCFEDFLFDHLEGVFSASSKAQSIYIVYRNESYPICKLELELVTFHYVTLYFTYRNQIFDHIHVRQRINLYCFLVISFVNLAQASEGVTTVNVHGARATNTYKIIMFIKRYLLIYEAMLNKSGFTFTTRATETQSRINFILYLDKSIQNHGSTIIHIYLVVLKARFF